MILLHPRRVGRDLGPEVAGGLVLRPDLGEDEAEDVVDDLAALTTLTGGMITPSWNTSWKAPIERGGATADIDVVGEVRDVADQQTVHVDGRDQADVVQVHAARVRVVGDDGVARPEVLGAVALDRVRHLLHHRAQVHRLRERLRDRPQLGVEEGAREVGAGLDVRGVGAALQRQHHLVGRCDERVADDLEGNGIDAGVCSRAQLRRRRLVELAPHHGDAVTSRARSTLTFSSSTSRSTRRLALLGRAVAAAATRAVAERAGLERDRHLGAEPRLLAAPDQHVLRHPAVVATEGARGAGLLWSTAP